MAKSLTLQAKILETTCWNNGGNEGLNSIGAGLFNHLGDQKSGTSLFGFGGNQIRVKPELKTKWEAKLGYSNPPEKINGKPYFRNKADYLSPAKYGI